MGFGVSGEHLLFSSNSTTLKESPASLNSAFCSEVNSERTLCWRLARVLNFLDSWICFFRSSSQFRSANLSSWVFTELMGGLSSARLAGQFVRTFSSALISIRIWSIWPLRTLMNCVSFSLWALCKAETYSPKRTVLSPRFEMVAWQLSWEWTVWILLWMDITNKSPKINFVKCRWDRIDIGLKPIIFSHNHEKHNPDSSISITLLKTQSYYIRLWIICHFLWSAVSKTLANNIEALQCNFPHYPAKNRVIFS